MPIYEFHCESCDAGFEVLVASSRTKVGCAACGSKKVRKRFSTFAAHNSESGVPCRDGQCPGAVAAASAGGSCAGNRSCPFS